MALPPNNHHLHGFNMFNYHEQDNNIPSPSSLNSLPSNCPPHLFSSGGGNLMMKRSMSFSGMERNHDHQLDQVLNGEDDLSDDGSQLGEKKKRLNIEQVKALEKSFELANKLEPERKMQLAKALGLQPRQIAIWFQNRRARWKTKQLEKDYEVLKKQFDALKADNDLLLAQNNKLQAELSTLKNGDCIEESRKKDMDQNSWSNGSTENSCENLNLDISNTKQQQHHSIFSTSMRPTTNVTHDLLTEKSDQLQGLKVDQTLVQDENFCNIFNGIDEQQGFWHWPADQHSSFSLHQPHFSNNGSNSQF